MTTLDELTEQERDNLIRAAEDRFRAELARVNALLTAALLERNAAVREVEGLRVRIAQLVAQRDGTSDAAIRCAQCAVPTPDPARTEDGWLCAACWIARGAAAE